MLNRFTVIIMLLITLGFVTSCAAAEDIIEAAEEVAEAAEEVAEAAEEVGEAAEEVAEAAEDVGGEVVEAAEEIMGELQEEAISEEDTNIIQGPTEEVLEELPGMSAGSYH